MLPSILASLIFIISWGSMMVGSYYLGIWEGEEVFKRDLIKHNRSVY
jgi:hypothetical protein